MIARALAKAPTDRYQSMGEMAADLARCRLEWAEIARRRANELAERARVVATLRSDLEQLRAWFGFSGTRPDAPARPGDETSQWGQATLISTAPGQPPRPAEASDDAAEQSRLAAEVARLRAARSAMEAADQALSAGRPREALPSLEQAARALPELPRAQEALDRCRRAVAELQRREERVQALVAEARDALARGDWQSADELAGEALEVEPASADAGQIRQSAAEGRDREAEEKARRFDECVKAATEAIDAGRLEDGADAIVRLRGLDEARTDVVSTLESQLAEARTRLAVERERSRRATSAIAAAHVEFESGRRNDAIASLVSLLEEEPGASGVAEEIARLRAEAARIEAREQRRASARAELDRARSALERGEFAAAIEAAQQALRFEDRLPEATRLVALAQVRQREAAEAGARAARVAEAVGRARDFIASGSLAKAAREISRALEIEPSDQAARAVEADLRRLEAESRAREEQEKQRRERARQAERFLKDARSALRARRYEDARSLLAQARTSGADPRDIQAIADEVAKAAAALAREDEDTVTQAAAADADDTVSLPPLEAGSGGGAAWARPWHVLRAWIRGAAERSAGALRNWRRRPRAAARQARAGRA